MRFMKLFILCTLLSLVIATTITSIFILLPNLINWLLSLPEIIGLPITMTIFLGLPISLLIAIAGGNNNE